MFNNHTIIHLSTQNNPVLTSQHLVSSAKVIRFLYSPPPPPKTTTVITNIPAIHVTPKVASIPVIHATPKVRSDLASPHRRKGGQLLNVVSLELKRSGPNGGNQIK
jgi:hypothetical protein